MNQKEIAQKLNILKTIEPSEGFINRTRLTIAIQSRQQNRKTFAWPWMIFTGAFAAVLLVANVFLNLSIVQPRLALFFNQNDLRNEFTELALNLKLPEISYQQNVDDAIVLALNEISDNQPSHLNTSLLQKEGKDLENRNNSQNQGEEIDALLEKVIIE